MVSPSIGVRSLPGGRRRGSVCCGSDRAGRLLAPVCGETERRAESYSGVDSNPALISRAPCAHLSQPPCCCCVQVNSGGGGVCVVKLGFGDMEKWSPSFLSGSTLRSYAWCAHVLGGGWW